MNKEIGFVAIGQDFLNNKRSNTYKKENSYS